MTTIRHRRITSFWQLSLVLLALAALPTAAFAARPVQTPHCMVRLEPSVNGQASAMTDGPCFETLAESVAAATGNRVKLPKTATPDEIDQALRAAEAEGDAGTTVDYVLSIEYSYAYFGTPSILFYGPTTCAAGSYYRNVMPSGWNDAISSSRGYSYCRVRHYEHGYRTGEYLTCVYSCATMGGMNNQTSSLAWFY